MTQSHGTVWILNLEIRQGFIKSLINSTLYAPVFAAFRENSNGHQTSSGFTQTETLKLYCYCGAHLIHTRLIYGPNIRQPKSKSKWVWCNFKKKMWPKWCLFGAVDWNNLPKLTLWKTLHILENTFKLPLAQDDYKISGCNATKMLKSINSFN